MAADDIDPRVAAIVAKTIGIDTHNHIDAVVDAMLKTGFTEDGISKIGGGNFCSIFDAATKGH